MPARSPGFTGRLRRNRSRGGLQSARSPQIRNIRAALTPADASASSTRSGKPPRRHDRPARSYRVPWADLLKKVFAVDVLACPCGGRLQFIAFIAEATVAKRILAHLGLDSRGPPLAQAQVPPDVLDPAPSYDGVDSAFPD